MYASADAARVGGGLYQAVVEALCTLATDPSPKASAVRCGQGRRLGWARSAVVGCKISRLLFL